MIKLNLSAVLCALAIASQVSAAIVDTSDRGWYDATGNHGSSNLNYVTGRVNFNETTLHRSFFYFDLSALSGPFSSATFEAYNPGLDPVFMLSGYESPNETETLKLFDVSTSLTDLLGGTGGTGAYNDLGDGIVFGEATVSSGDNNTFVSITLNPVGLAALNLAVGGDFIFGAALTTLSSSTGNEHIFAFTNDGILADTRLILDAPAGQVPEPGSLALFAGLSLLIGVRHIRLRRFGHNR